MKPSEELVNEHGCENIEQFLDVISCYPDRRLICTGLIDFLPESKREDILKRVNSTPNSKDFKFEVGKYYEIRLAGGQICGLGYVKYIQHQGEILTEEQLHKYFANDKFLQSIFRDDAADYTRIFTQYEKETNSNEYSSLIITDNLFVKEIVI